MTSHLTFSPLTSDWLTPKLLNLRRESDAKRRDRIGRENEGLTTWSKENSRFQAIRDREVCVYAGMLCRSRVI